MGMFKKKSRPDPMPDDRSSGGIRSTGNSSTASPRSSTSAPTGVYGNTRNKKGRFGSKLKGLVRISSKRSSSDAKSTGSKDSMQDSQDGPSTPPRLVPKIVEQFNESGSSSSSSSGDEKFRQQLGTVAEVNEDEYNSDIEPIWTKKSSDIAGFREVPAQKRKPSKSNRLGGGKNVKIANPVSLVILLVDPTFQQFELLQWQHHHPKNLKVKLLLTQLQSSITNSSIRKLKFDRLLDREGRLHVSSTKLSQAVSQERDILVGLVKGVQDVGRLMKEVRPILGDADVGKLLDMNGFDTKGWVAKKKTKASILDRAKPSQHEPQGGGTANLTVATMVMLALLIAIDALIVHLNNKDMFVQPLISWESVLQGMGQWIVNSTKYFVSNKRVHESSTCMPESVSTVAENLVPITVKSKEAVETAKDLVMMATDPATQVAEVVSTIISNMTSNATIISNNMTSNVTSTSNNITSNATFISNNMTSNATSTIANSETFKAINTSNSVWEEYAVIALLVCILLNWLAM